MQRNVWASLMRAVIVLVLIVSLLASGYGLLAVGADLFVEYEAWDGMGLAIGVVVLVVALPIVAICVVWLRLLRRHW